jgi:hypothetical protein
MCYVLKTMTDQVNLINQTSEPQKKRPDPIKVLDEILEKYDFSGLREENKGDAVKAVRENRWGDDF